MHPAIYPHSPHISANRRQAEYQVRVNSPEALAAAAAKAAEEAALAAAAPVHESNDWGIQVWKGGLWIEVWNSVTVGSRLGAH